MKTTDSLQKAGGIAALIASATYLSAIALVLTIFSPMADPNLPFGKYIDFLKANKTPIYIWHFSMYLINGICLVILSIALYERIKPVSPVIMKIATVIGLIWTSFVFLSGFLVIHGTEAFIDLNSKNAVQAEALRKSVETITFSIDSSDKFLGCLWVGLMSIAAYKKTVWPNALNIFGMIISAAGLIGIIIPQLIAISYVFGMGAILWWLFLGIFMLKKKN